VGFDFDNLASWQNGVALLLSGIQIVCYLMAGNKNRWGWIVGLTGAIPWCVVMLGWDAYGLLPLVVFLQVIYVINFVKWTRDDKYTNISADVHQCPKIVNGLFACIRYRGHEGRCLPHSESLV
jgi:nicotinamide riboside transporter PnuC